MNICDYGCGGESNFVMKNGKNCCSKHYSSCPAIKEKNSKGVSKSLKEQYENGVRTSHFVEYNKSHFRHEVGVWSHTEETKDLLSKTSKGVSDTEGEKERRRKISDSIKKRYEDGWMPKAGRCKKIRYTSNIAGEVLLDGGWELSVAEYLDDNKIDWVRNVEKFVYVDSNGKERKYTPDFYLKESDTFLEVKGYKTDLDDLKWSQFPKTLEVWDKSVLKEKGIL